MWLFFWRQRERRRNKRQSTYRRPKWSEYYEEKSLQLPIENYTCSTRLCFSYFICDNKHTFGKQIPPDLAMLLAFLIETVDWLDKNESRMLNQIQIIVHSTSQYITSCSDGKVVKRLHSHKLLIWQPCGTVLTGWTMIWVWIQRWNEPNFTQLNSADILRDQCTCATLFWRFCLQYTSLAFFSLWRKHIRHSSEYWAEYYHRDTLIGWNWSRDWQSGILFVTCEE